LGFGVWVLGFGFGVWGLGFGVWGLGFGGLGLLSEFLVLGSDIYPAVWLYSTHVDFSLLWCVVQGLGFEGLGFRLQGIGFRVRL
jgi:hypothetical protein